MRIVLFLVLLCSQVFLEAEEKTCLNELSGHKKNTEDLLENLAALEHDQWVHWSQATASKLEGEGVDTKLLLAWEKYWVPYDELSEEAKEKDRVWARKVLELVVNAH